MHQSLKCRCENCSSDNDINAMAADVPNYSEVNCSHCGAYIGLWGELMAREVMQIEDAGSVEPGMSAG